MNTMSANHLKNEMLEKYLSVGSDKFYRFLLALAIAKLSNIKDGNKKTMTPDLEYLECHNKFLAIYRKENNPIFLDIAKVFRKAAHRIYREMLKKELTPRNSKFLNVV